MAAGGCGILNSVYDKDIDLLMLRTSKRAIPSGQVASKNAMALGALLLASSFICSYLLFNLLTSLMLILGAVFYLIIYTVWLKRTSPWNVVIGGLAGCFAALSGWTAAVNTLSIMPLLVATLDFLWTPGHLWGLAIKKVKEYKKAEIPMLPVKFGLKRSSQIVLWLNVLTVIFSLILPVLGLAGILYFVAALAAGAAFLFQNRGLFHSSSEVNGFKVFLASMPYLAFLMTALVLDKII